VDDVKLPSGKKLRFTCKNKQCNAVLRFRADEFGNIYEISDEENTPQSLSGGFGGEQSDASKIALWFALVDGQEMGPMSISDLKSLIQSKKVTERTYMWREGMSDWLRLQDIEALHQLLQKELSPKVKMDFSDAKTDETLSLQRDLLQSEESKANKADELGDPQGFEADPLDELESLPDDAAQDDPLTLLMLGEPTGEFMGREAIEKDDDEAGSRLRVGTDASYFEGQPGESTQIFMLTAGLFRRKRQQQIAAVSASALVISLTAAIGGDLSGYWEIPGMGLFYDSLGVEDPSTQRKIERVEKIIQSRKLSPKEKKALEKKRLALQEQLMGNSKTARRSHSKSKKQASSRASDNAPVQKGIQEAAAISKDEKDVMASIFRDTRKAKTKFSLKPVTKIQTPDLPDGLTAESITDVINDNQGAMKLCIAKSMKGGENPSGRMEIEMVIAVTGRVSSAKVITSKFARTTIASCTSKAVQRWRFPAFNGSPATVVFPYVLTSTF
jgi:hypothetical protein